MKRNIKLWVVLAGILILAGCLRYIGINWDYYSHSHPDELFLTAVVSRIGDRSELLDKVKERCADDPRRHAYFNTRCSPLNPNNINDGSYAYGTLPTFIVYGAGELAVKITGDELWRDFDGIHLVGRFVNIIADVLSTLMVFIIGRRLFGIKNGLFASMLYAAAALPIQLAHYWTVDTIANLFFLISLYAAVAISQRGRAWAFILFGLAVGAGVASRINIAMAAGLGPLAGFIYLRTLYLHRPDAPRKFHFGQWIRVALLITIASGIGFLTFRIAQPYAFKGPDIWDLQGNKKWFDDIDYVSKLSSKQDDGWPPSHQFVGRIKYIYPWINIVLWGMGLPLGILATIALIHAINKQVQRWELSPQVALLTAWFIAYFGWHGRLHYMTMRYYLPLYGVLCLLVAWWLLQLQPRWSIRLRKTVAIGTLLWAFVFTGIYRAPQTRVEAAIWINQHMPAAVTGIAEDGTWYHLTAGRGMRYRMVTYYKPEPSFGQQSYESRLVNITGEGNIMLKRLWLRWIETTPIHVNLQLAALNDEGVETELLLNFDTTSENPQELRVDLPLDKQVEIAPGNYRWKMTVDWDTDVPMVHIIPSIEYLNIESGIWSIGAIQLQPTGRANVIRYAKIDNEYSFGFVLKDKDQTLTGLYIAHAIGLPSNLTLEIEDEKYTAQLVSQDRNGSPLGEGRHYVFKTPLRVPHDTAINITSTYPLWFTGTTIATEGDWDFSTPPRICFQNGPIRLGYFPPDTCLQKSGYDEEWYTELPLQVVEHDSPEKQRWMTDVLLLADYMTISTNRMYDALPRNEKYYWFTTAYYKDLFGDKLGYQEVVRFDSLPHLGPLTIPDQVLPDWHLPKWMNELEAEEAFTVYDHPTIYVFKNDGFESSQMTAYVPYVDERNRIDLDEVAQPTYVASEKAAHNREIQWQIALFAIGFIAVSWLAFPLMFTLFPSLPLRGYGLGRGVTWLLLALIPWWLTAEFHWRLWTRWALIGFVAGYIVLMTVLFIRQRHQLWPFIKTHWCGMVALDLVWLVAFGLGIAMRGVDPDFWHPWLGGEKHMDLAYLNAVWRTGQFPPPSPWLSGFEINYYYLGFVVAAMPLKLFGSAPEYGPNLILAVFYATIFTLVFNLLLTVLGQVERVRWRVLLASTGTTLVMIAGNYGAFDLVIQSIANMPAHRWYWYPTRMIAESKNGGGGIITEVPFFSFLWGDFHAHLFGLLPVTILLTLLWVTYKQRAWWHVLALGSLISIIYMTNTWDILVYVPLTLLVIILISRHTQRLPLLLALFALGAGVMVWPYLQHATLAGYGSITRWEGPRSILKPFLLTWGAPLAVMLIWLVHRIKAIALPEADAPVEVGLFILAVIPALWVNGQDGTSVLLVTILLLALLLAVFDRKNIGPHCGVAFFTVGLLAIEHVVIVGDVDRMNTGFKVAFQLWVWAGLLIPMLLYHMVHQRRAYIMTGVSVLVLLPGLIFPYKALPARDKESYTKDFTLDGYDFMDVMPYPMDSETISIADDEPLIRYMRSHIQGYPVIAEMYTGEYRWNTRIASYTGLPTVMGWGNHMRQQFPHQIEEIEQRIGDIRLFYTTTSTDQLLQLIRKYHIEYIVSGELEHTLDRNGQFSVLLKMVTSGHLSVEYQSNNTWLFRVEKTQ
ncbi:MAG: glycosyltransferase family 39 protein [Chloroflexi bacterium]|nr:glycosyltransferase family 39 protein [Chloroflexota bacterium]